MATTSKTLPLLYKDPKTTVTIYVWHSNAVLLALGKGFNSTKEVLEKNDKIIDLNPYTGHAAIQVGDDPDNYISLWGRATLHTKQDDENYFSGKRGYGRADVEVKLYSLDTGNMLDAIDKFKNARNRGQINFSLYNIWQYDDTNQYNCACLVQELLNIGGIWNLVEPRIDRISGAIIGAGVGAIVAATSMATSMIGMGDCRCNSVAGPGDYLLYLRPGAALGSGVVVLASGAASKTIIDVAKLNLALDPAVVGTIVLIGAGVGAFVGGFTGAAVDASDVERKLLVTPTDVANLANLLSEIERKKYALSNHNPSYIPRGLSSNPYAFQTSPSSQVRYDPSENLDLSLSPSLVKR